MFLLKRQAVCDNVQLSVMPRAVSLRALLCSSLWRTVGKPNAPQAAAVPMHELVQHWLKLSMLSTDAREARVTSVYTHVALKSPIIQNTCTSDAPICYERHTRCKSPRMLNISFYQKREKECYCL